MPADTDQPTLAVIQADREAARQFIADEWPSWDADHQTVSAALMVAFARHRTNFERPAGDLREAAQRVVDDYPAAAGACASIEGGDGKPGWGSIRRLAEALATLSPGATSLEGGEGVERIVSRAIHEHLSRRDIMQYLDNEEDCQGLARSVVAALAAPTSTQGV